MINIKIHENALYVNEELVKFQYEIDTVIVLDSQVIVLIKTPYDIDKNDNIYSVDLHGKINWQIEPAKKRFPKVKHSAYVGISYEKGNLWVYSYLGMDIIVDVKNGKILRIQGLSRF